MTTKKGVHSIERLLQAIEVEGGDEQPKQNKTIRIRKAYNQRVMVEALERSRKAGRRVTESDVIDEALTLLFALQELQKQK